ncbi:MAG: PriCT-2 domain-containing protein [Bacteroidaceae bacterium]|nr:PriCT-2 domain-containing protein [Bacteroidaceae bacterium]
MKKTHFDPHHWLVGPAVPAVPAIPAIPVIPANPGVPGVPELPENPLSQENPVSPASSHPLTSYEKVTYLVSRLSAGSIDITADYDSWMRVGMALATEFGEGGRAFFHEVSRLNPSYKPDDCDLKYDNLLRTGRGSVTIATFYRMAKEKGIVCPRYKATTPETPSRELTEAKAVLAKVSKENVRAVTGYLLRQGDWRRNVILECVEWRPRDTDRWERVDDYIVNTQWRHMCEEGVKTNPGIVWAVINSDMSATYDPLHDYLRSLPEWREGDPDYIGSFAAMVHTDGHDDDFRTDFRKWFVSMVAMWKGMGINQQILVLIGPQGIYKTSWLNAILPPELADYRSTRMDCSQMTKDDRTAISQHPIINLEELDAMNHTELNQLKALSTAVSSNERPAYARTKVCRRRIASFCGSGNNQYFLTDRTGNRRWLIFNVISIDSPFTADIPYQGMYAQALALVNAGFSFYFTTDEINYINSRNTEFEVPDPAEEFVRTYFAKPEGDDPGLFMTATEILNYCCPPTTLQIKSQHISAALKKLGYKMIARRGIRGFRVQKVDADRRVNNQRIMAREIKDES